MPKTKTKTSTAQSKTANVSIEDLYNKYVKTIDDFRSYAMPPSFNAPATTKPRDEKKATRYSGGKNQNPAEYQESRTHAFYRMIGFPVVSKSKFYNNGYNPYTKEPIKYNDIDKAALSDYKDLIPLIIARETSFKDKINIFRNKNNLSVVYAGALPIIKKFNIIDGDNKGPLEPCVQDSVISERTQYFQENKYILTTDEEGLQRKYISGCPHILKPFIVHPEIANCATPGDRMVAVPFLLKATDVKATDTQTIRRSIIELIIMARLSDTNSGVLNNQLDKILNVASYSGPLADAFNALGGEDNFENLKKDPDLSNRFENFSNTELENIEMFSQAIRSLVSQLNDAIEVWNRINIQIQMEPMPNTYGPEFGGVSRVSMSKPSNIDINIAYLKLKQALAQGTTQIDLTQYAQSSGLDGSLKKDNSNDLAKLTKQRDDLVNQAMGALKIIEIITGEVSGIGLVDILSVHLALWSIDIRYLLGFLDTDAVNRCAEFDDRKLTNEELIKQIGGDRPTIVDCLKKFEKAFFNSLSFADAAFSNNQKSPSRSGTR